MRIRYSIHPDDHRIIFIFFTIWVVSLLLSALLFIFGPPLIPLWYSLTLPVEQLAPKIAAWTFPGLGAVITILSLWQARRTDFDHNRYLARLSLISGLVLLIFLLIAQLRIIKIILWILGGL